MRDLRAIFGWLAGPSTEPGDYINDGNVSYSQQKFDQAIADYSEAIRLDPGNAGAFSNRGMAWNGKKQFDQAIADFSAAIRLDPNSIYAFGGRGCAWLQLQKYELALVDFDEAVRCNPRDVSCRLSRAYVWYLKKDFDQALVDYNEAIRLDSNSVEAHSGRGTARLAKQEVERGTLGLYQLDRPESCGETGSSARLGYDLAIDDFSMAIRVDPSNADAYCRRGNAWHAIDEYDRAIDDLTTAIRLDPKFAHALSSRAHVWRDKCQYAKAIDDFNDAIRQAPEDVWAINGLAWLMGSALDPGMRDGRRAVALARDALALDPDNFALMDTLAVAYAETGNFGEAISWQERSLQKSPPPFEAEMRERLGLYRKQQPYRQKKRRKLMTQFTATNPR